MINNLRDESWMEMWFWMILWDEFPLERMPLIMFDTPPPLPPPPQQKKTATNNWVFGLLLELGLNIYYCWRDIASARALCLPGTYWPFNCIVLIKVTSTSSPIRDITLSDEDDCLLMIWTRARLSMCKLIFLFCSAWPHIVKAKTIGTNSKNEISCGLVYLPKNLATENGPTVL